MKKWKPSVPLTIEEQLRAYSETPNHTDRHKILWHAWNQDKHWLSQLLELTMTSFPTYSRHNESHAKSILHNIERILGENRIKKLSATDCFVILHTAYLHDIGMCITAGDRKNAITSEEFKEFLDNIEAGNDNDLKKAAIELMRTAYPDYEGNDSIQKERVFNEKMEAKLDVYYSVVQLMSEFFRKSHGERSKNRITDWTLQPDELGAGFSMSGIPLRIFLRIADCSVLHTDWDFQHILNLLKEDSGYAHDMMHPRFAAVMLQLGDALDIDNDRFHLFARPFMGAIPKMSELHYQKHQSIRQLQITPEEIIIEADCSDQETLRLVRQECEGVERLLKLASYHWSEISPPNLKGCLPNLKSLKIRLDGKNIPEGLVDSRFNISQERAFGLLEGANVYKGKFVFLRELLQNAIDATKIQCWIEYKEKNSFYFKKKERQLEDYLGIIEDIDFTDYPIEIWFQICGRKRGAGGNQKEYIKVDDRKDNPEIEYGVKITVKDYGTGISSDDITAMSNVGVSHSNKKTMIDHMPVWLQPTGKFGIGLQSVFLVCDRFSCLTSVRNGEKYEISFSSASSGNGYINVKPIDNVNLSYGTAMEIFVPVQEKLSHEDCMEAWNLETPDADRFSREYVEKRQIRHASELMTQMIFNLDPLIRDIAFPIYLHVEKDGISENEVNFIKRRVNHVIFSSGYESGKHTKEELSERTNFFLKIRNDKNQKLYIPGKDNFEICRLKNGISIFDCENIKLYIFDTEYYTYARLGASRLNSRFEKMQPYGEDEGFPCYLKGIYLDNVFMSGDLELIEYIDIQNTLEKRYININRNSFTEDGQQYFEQKIYNGIIKIASEALYTLGRKDTDIVERVKQCIDKKLEKLEKLKNSENSEYLEERLRLEKNIREMISSLAGIAYFVQIQKNGDGCWAADDGETCNWLTLISYINKKGLKEKHPNLLKGFLNQIHVISSEETYKAKTRTKTGKSEETETILELLESKEEFAVVSRRKKKGETWNNYILHLGRNYYSELKKIAVWDKKELFDFLKMWETEGQNNVEDIIRLLWNLDLIYTAEERLVINWIMKNIPTIGMWSSKDGNTRINLVSVKSKGGILYDSAIKRLLLERMAEYSQNNNSKRFVTMLWRGYECLELNKMPESVCWVSRGYIAKHQKKFMLMPFKGEYMSEIIRGVECVELEELFKKLWQLINIKTQYVKFYSIYVDMVKRDILNKNREELRELYVENNEVFSEDEFSLFYAFKEKGETARSMSEMSRWPDELRRFFIRGIQDEIDKLKISEQTEIIDTEKRSEQLKEYSALEGERQKEEKSFLKLIEKLPDQKELFEEVFNGFILEKQGNTTGGPSGEEKNSSYNTQLIGSLRNFAEVIYRTLSRIERIHMNLWDGTEENLQTAYFDMQVDPSKGTNIKEQYERVWGGSYEKDEMINYVQKNIANHLSYGEIEQCYFRLFQDFIRSLIRIKLLELEKIFNMEFWRKNINTGERGEQLGGSRDEEA